MSVVPHVGGSKMLRVKIQLHFVPCSTACGLLAHSSELRRGAAIQDGPSIIELEHCLLTF
jgi:hypothetical protein